MIFEEAPEDFDPVCEVVSCFVEHDGKILLLHRQDHKPQGNTWRGPAGKVDVGEDIHEAIKRETFEETGIELNEPRHFKKLFVRSSDYNFVYNIFHEVLDEIQEVVLRKEENKDFLWVEPMEAMKMPPMLDEDNCIKLFYGLK